MRVFIEKLLLFTLISSIIVSCDTSKKSSADDEPRRIEILFLGHAEEHHNSRAYFPILASALTKKGINITYTQQVSDLNTKTLSLYDGLIIYANHEEISKSQETALLDYVAEGHAFIPIHSASFCFKNSSEYIALVGGQFSTHETGTFVADIINKEHPTMESFETFSTWDETYVHDKISKDISVLMERVEGEHHEPYTWVKKHGKGKVFYTAYGHDEKTWENLGFQKLIGNGILWAVNKSVKDNWTAYIKDIPKLTYKEMGNIPNYEKRDPAPKYQMPLSPEESKKLIQVPPGFQLELFASEPDIINPMAMNWDEKGRLWVIETVDYPNTIRDDKNSGDDRIKICEDTNGDGKADKFTIFADHLNIPTSFAFTNGGIIISQAPNFLFLKDTDGDDKADIKEVIIEGWGVYDTHAGPSNLQNGIDNNIYGVVGYSGYEGKIFGQDFKFKQGIYRFDANLEDFEFLTNTSNNTWGLGITEGNSIFASTANNTHSVFLGINNSYFDTVEGIPAQGSKKIDGHYDMQSITPNIRQVDVFGGFTAAAGHHFYTAREYPSSFWNKTAFVCEPTGNLVHIAKIIKDGAGFIEKDGGNLMASSDEWVSPIEAKVGPDGQVWVLDWYNFIVQHNPTPTIERGGYPAKKGNGNAYENPLRDKSRGRIWRIVHKKSEKNKPLKLDSNNTKELIETLSNNNLFWRLTAQRLLVEKGDLSILPDLYALVNNNTVDELNLNSGALHALWTIEGLGVIKTDDEAQAVVSAALSHHSKAVRKAAIQIMPKNQWADNAIIKADALNDKDPDVQLATLLYFADRTASKEIGSMLFELNKDEKIENDTWLSKAMYIAASKHKVGFLSAFKNANPNFKVNTKKKEENQNDRKNRNRNAFENTSVAELLANTYMKSTDLSLSEDKSTNEKSTIIHIKTIPNEMKYDLTEFTVEVGKQIELVFENNDFMQHNIVITLPNKKDIVGRASDKLAMDADGSNLNYVPEIPEVLFATAIVNPDDNVVLKFTAPLEPGIYPYICTFPGHWRIMQGTMKVVANKFL